MSIDVFWNVVIFVYVCKTTICQIYCKC